VGMESDRLSDHGQCRTGRGKLPGNLGDGLLRQSGLFRYPWQIVRLESVQQLFPFYPVRFKSLFIMKGVFQDQPGKPQCQCPLAPGPGRQPAVGGGTGQRHAATDVGEMTAYRIPFLTHPAESVAVLDWRQVRLDEIGAKAEQIAGLGQIIPGEARLTETSAVGRTQPVWTEQIEGYMVGRAEG